MKEKKIDEIVTRTMLDHSLDRFGDKILKRIFLEMRLNKEEVIRITDEKLKLYRDEVLTKMDSVVGELAEHREEREFIKYDIADHEKRITRLESH